MYTANWQLGRGLPGAYYETSGTPQQQQQYETSTYIMQQRHLKQQQHMHQLQHNHQHHQPHHHHQQHTQQQQQQQHSYPVTSASNSSLGSSGAFATSSGAFASLAVRRTTGWLRDFCSKRCLLVTCLVVILFIFILVTSLSAYLNFLINANKVNLQPVSGRLRVMLDAMEEGNDTDQPAEMRRQLMALTSLPVGAQHTGNLTKRQVAGGQQFLLKQRDFETILRGALDRTQPMLKTYPNHLVKLEVYSFKPSGANSQQQLQSNNDLWVYFRLFLNKRSLQQDQLLMRRKSPDEQFERQFLPRLTQQTLLNGFEQLITSFGSSANANSNASLQAAASRQRGGASSTSSSTSSARPEHQVGINSRRFGGPNQQQVDEERHQLSASWSSRRSSRSTPTPTVAGGEQAAAGTKLKSFDEQISRLMQLIGAIDLQSIYVTPEFDMIQTMPQTSSELASQIMSETLRANQPIIQTTTTPTTTTTNTAGNNVMPASGSTEDQYETLGSGNIEANNNKLAPATTPNGKLTSGGQPPASGVDLADSSARQLAKTQFTLDQSYRENTTRPSQPQSAATTTTTSTTTTSSTRRPAQTSGESPFLVNQRQKPTASPTSGSSTQSSPGRASSQAPASSRPVVQLVSGQPVVSQAGDKLVALVTANNKPQQGLFAPLPKANSSSASSSTSITIPELWQNAFSKQKPAGEERLNNAPETSARPRLITVTTIGNVVNSSAGLIAPADSKHLAPSEWHKISVLEPPAGQPQQAQPQRQPQAKPIRAQLNAPSGGHSNDEPANDSRPTTSSTSRPPKVAPHLNLGGSLMSAAQKPADNSAVLLSRDLLPQTANNNNNNSTRNNQPKLSQVQRNPSGQKQQLKKERQPGATMPKSTRKPAKIKKVIGELEGAGKSHNQTTPPNSKPPPASQKGIRIVDNFLTSIGSGGGGGGTNKTLARATEPAPAAPAAATTLPSAAIELTRSSAATTPAAGRATTPSMAPGENSENGFVLATQQARPGTSSFSGQWRPLNNAGSSPPTTTSSTTSTETEPRDFWATTTASNRTASSTAKPRAQRPNGGNLSLILPTEKLPSTLNQATGSQSPFSMPSLMMGQPQTQPQQPVAHFTARLRAAANSQQPPPQQRTSTPSGNDFESRRVSRMRQSQFYSHRAEDFADPFGNAAGSSNSQSSTTTTTSTTTTSSSLLPVDVSASPANARIVDDFLITTTPQDEGRLDSAPATVAPDTYGSLVRTRQLEPPAHSAGPTIISLVLPQGLRRTRGPFAFETLRSFAPAPLETSSESISSPSEPVAPLSPDHHHHHHHFGLASASDSIRSEGGAPLDILVAAADLQRHRDQQRDEQAPSQEKLLLRKRLSVGDDSFELSANSDQAADSLQDNPERTPLATDERSYGSRRQQSDRCEHFGCRSRNNSSEFICLNSSQICNDLVDCADETDELDCVSLLKLDPKLQRMSFSNGAGIIYLNRRGVLAPMCVDDDYDQGRDQLQAGQLIKRINAIGQYACDLQSFSRLVSIKINHHDQVDGSNLIRNSRQFHRLALAEGRGGGELASDPAQSSSPGRIQMSISSSSECPSQRTVFVKCGGFQCGRDSFETSGAPEEDQPVNDFPWLVKLFHEEALACQGYLIDESWLVASAECFNGTLLEAHPGGDQNRLLDWTAEISHEHHGNQYYKSIESNRRQLKRVLVQPRQSASKSSAPSVVLAELERPVRFSPLNRPICLPALARATATTTPTNSRARISSGTAKVETAANFSHCLTASLRVAPDSEGSPTRRRHSNQPHQLVLDQVELAARVEDCLRGGWQPALNASQGDEQLACAISSKTSRAKLEAGRDESSGDDQPNGAARVLICSQSIKASELESAPKLRWAFVGTQLTGDERLAAVRPDGQLFVSAADQIEWIVDTMNPKQESGQNGANPNRSMAQDHNQKHNLQMNYTNTPFHLRLSSSRLNPTGEQTTNELNPLFNNNQQQTCNSFRCSSGECLTWSRICDGLYDCSSHDDEKDCHK